ncbi:hypothetical protein G6F56_005043 [Rhizopus delemar]|uniref:Nitrogen regulatory protein areA GATA-like domain-containing protein n=1 Tax=Rhizopus stolonifer TaxID=4846 RepID=A0A367K184_RHIST|nr:hypothetical protein G6F56_005043 [Rhizopus delemar]RCH96002.1 hypothetical protein CU098_005921 [Rhizopus stolonifer]
MYSSEIHFPLLINSNLSEQSLPWNNLDQLSSLWATFTKCKSNIRDGFRLENLSWRLWYRQSVLQKKQKPNTVQDIDFAAANTHTHSNTTVTLRRTRSLPNLQTHQPPKRSRKFFIEEIAVKKPALRRATTAPKPVSALSEMISKTKLSSNTNNTGLRRCQSRYTKLDQLFLNAA